MKNPSSLPVSLVAEQRRTRRPYSRLAVLALSLSLAACGVSGPAPTAPLPDGQADAALQLVTLNLAPSVTEAALQAALPQARILGFYPATRQATVALPAAQSGASSSTRVNSAQSGNTLSQLDLGGLQASVVNQENNAALGVMQTADPESMGSVAWAGGTMTWAGGNLTWAGGRTFLDSVTYNAVVTYWNKVNLIAAHQKVPELGQGVRVAVIDTGIDHTHPLLQGRIDTASGYDFVGKDSHPQEVPLAAGAAGPNKFGHGTAVAGVVAQYAPNAQLIVYRVLRPNGVGLASDVVLAINAAVKAGAKVINLSLGSTSDVAALNTAIKNALASGVVVVASSGNTGAEGMLYPARNAGNATKIGHTNSGFLAVGSVTLGGQRSAFTSYASNMSLTSPGEQVVTTFPNSRLARASGTSFAAPAVSGAVALALSTKAADLTPNSLAISLRNTADQNQDPVYNTKLGRGRLNVAYFISYFR